MSKITREIIESYIDCHYKAHLALRGPGGASPGEANPPAKEVARHPPPSKRLVQLAESEKHFNNQIKLTPAYLGRGHSTILDGIHETDTFSLCFDGLRRVSGPSDLGDFHYVPVIFENGSKTQKYKTKLLLDVYGLILSSLQGRIPDSGIVNRNDGKPSKMRLSHGLRRGKQLLKAVAALHNGELPPDLVLNEHCPVCQFQSHCHAQAVQEDNLSLLRGISRPEIIRLKNKGIFTVKQLSYTFRPRRIKKRAKRPAHIRHFALQALALREQKVFVHGTPPFTPSGARIYIDFEGVPVRQFYYLIGVVVAYGGNVDQKSFWADDESGEAQIFFEMLDYINSYQDFTILHFGAYETRALKRMQRRLPAEYQDQIAELLKRTVNILAIIGPHIYFPVFSNGLKDIAGYLGHRWSASNASGIQTLAWRAKWCEARDERMKEELIRYNMEDCHGLRIVSDFVERVSMQLAAGPNANDVFVHTDHIEKEADARGKFQHQDFALKDFDFINRCAYFDYQRERMLARGARKRTCRPAPQRQNAARQCHRSNKIVDVHATRCPACRSKKLASIRPLERQIVDLKFSGAAVRRWIVTYQSNRYRCENCGTSFVPDGFPKNRSMFGTGLVIWCAYQMVVGGQNMSRIQGGLETLFKIRLDVPTIYRFKQMLSFHYQRLYSEILVTLLTGPVLYIDETPANLRSVTGYVWCVTDGRSVYYFYRSSREGSFLNDMFKDFEGVLVSDFYTAYDSLHCAQQRCLVHLMRDINEEMQRRPFDDELKLMAAEFSKVLKTAVATIDNYGFKARHLAKHRRPAWKFCQWVSEQEFRSASAERLRSRITKYRDKLFTFLEYDGVSWNNTNAEQFIKPFAWHRRTANGIFTERSIQDYLVILSLSETCAGRGQNFLEFLLEDNKGAFNFKSARRVLLTESATARVALTVGEQDEAR